MLRKPLLWSLLLALSPPCLLGQPCPVKPGPNSVFQNQVSQNGSHFEWYSAYARDPSAGNENTFDRHVRNLGPGVLNFTWPIGRLYSLALPPGESVSVCEPFGWPIPKRGPLKYGALASTAPTEVWEGQDEPKAQDLLSRFIFFFEDDSGDPKAVLTLESKFTGSAYHYWLRNAGQQTLRVSWTVGQGRNLFDELPKPSVPPAASRALPVGSRSEEALAALLRKGRTLEPGQTISITLESGAPPTAIPTNFDVGSVASRPLAGSILSILVPEK